MAQVTDFWLPDDLDAELRTTLETLHAAGAASYAEAMGQVIAAGVAALAPQPATQP